MAEGVRLNYEVLNVLQDIMEDNLPLLIKTYMKDSSNRLQAMQAALESKDYESLRLSAHTLKGSSSNLGAEKLKEMCQMLEHAAKTGKLDGAPAALIEIKNEYHQVVAALANYG